MTSFSLNICQDTYGLYKEERDYYLSVLRISGLKKFWVGMHESSLALKIRKSMYTGLKSHATFSLHVHQINNSHSDQVSMKSVLFWRNSQTSSGSFCSSYTGTRNWFDISNFSHPSFTSVPPSHFHLVFCSSRKFKSTGRRIACSWNV